MNNRYVFCDELRYCQTLLSREESAFMENYFLPSPSTVSLHRGTSDKQYFCQKAMETKCTQRPIYFTSTGQKANCKELQNREQRASRGENATNSKLTRRSWGWFALTAGAVFSACSTQESHCFIITTLNILKVKTTTVWLSVEPRKSARKSLDRTVSTPRLPVVQ